ncbi:hypothetical protein [Dysosmobacter sp.]|uniref:hypothetical protein n=1 Tax=Dysosmobacter sp. TaxID=2591382 RepID=UPI003A9116D1
MKKSTKRLVILALAMTLMFTLVACGKKDDTVKEQTDDEETTEETHTISGTVNRLDDYLVLLDDAGDYHVFDFGEDVDPSSLEEGDKVTVTYNGTLDSDDPAPVATAIEKAAD